MADTGTPEKLLTSLFRAWHGADVATFGALFTGDASYVTGDGRVFIGAEAIGRLPSTHSLEGVRLEQTLEVRIHGDVASLLCKWSATDSGRSGIASVIAVRHDRIWLIERFHNTNSS